MHQLCYTALFAALTAVCSQIAIPTPWQIPISLATLAVFFIVTAIILYIVKKLSNSSRAPFRKTNKFLGAVFGVLKALIILFAFARIGAFITENVNAGDNAFLQQLASSTLIELLNKFNPIMII